MLFDVFIPLLYFSKIILFYLSRYHYYSESTYNYMMSPGKDTSNYLFNREISTGDPQKHNAMEMVTRDPEFDNRGSNGIIHSSKSNPQLNMMRRYAKSSNSINDENDDPSLFLLRPAENRFVLILFICI